MPLFPRPGRYSPWERRVGWQISGLSEEALAAIHKRFTYRIQDLEEFMKGLLQRFTQWFNRAHSRNGRLWEDRFKSVIVEDGVAAKTISKSTGEKSVIIAVPVKKNHRVVGGIGASIFVDDLSQLLNERLKLPAGSLFYALTADGQAFHPDH